MRSGVRPASNEDIGIIMPFRELNDSQQKALYPVVGRYLVAHCNNNLADTVQDRIVVSDGSSEAIYILGPVVPAETIL